jgi:glycine C-acetyltransferase
MIKEFKIYLQQQLADIQAAGLFKTERVIASPQGVEIKLQDGNTVINFCANNYLGLADHPAVITAAKAALDERGYGLSSVRFICGTQDGHKNLENKISKFLGTDDTILYGSAFDANGGLFEPLLGAEDAIISDALNHASIIDGVRLCQAQRFRYQNADMADLEEQLKLAAGARFRLIVTDGVFSMDGVLAPLAKICDLAEKYGALVMVDDSHATGFIGPQGRGTADYYGVTERVDIITSTLGKALGGAMGGFTSGRQEIIDFLRQRSRPYLFSNSLAPVIVGAAQTVLDLVAGAQDLRAKVMANAAYFRGKLTAAGFAIKPGIHPIVPVMLYDAAKAQEMAQKLLAEGIYVIGFFYPVVPQGQARIRVQVSAAHTQEQLDQAIAAFIKIGRELQIIN